MFGPRASCAVLFLPSYLMGLGCMYGGAENARLENAGLELSGTRNVWNATCGIT